MLFAGKIRRWKPLLRGFCTRETRLIEGHWQGVIKRTTRGGWKNRSKSFGRSAPKAVSRPMKIPTASNDGLTIDLDPTSRWKHYRWPLLTFVPNEHAVRVTQIRMIAERTTRQLSLPEVVRMAAENVIDTQWYTRFAFFLNYIPTSRPMRTYLA